MSKGSGVRSKMSFAAASMTSSLDKPAAGIDPRLQREHRLEHRVRLVLIARDVGVLVQTENLRFRHQRKFADVLDEILHRLRARADVVARGGPRVLVPRGRLR